MRNIDFRLLTNENLVQRYLALPVDVVASLLDADQRSLYRPMDIRKRGRRRLGQYRRVYEVTDGHLRSAQKQLAVAVAAQSPVSGQAHGFVRGRSTVTNATQHLGAEVVLHADIRDFFESISAAHVMAGFVSLGAAPEAARLLARLVTLDGHLVQGPSSSPAIANLICAQLDVDLGSVAASYSATYTRYSDDLTFSGRKVPEMREIDAAVARSGFQLAPEKTRYQHRGRFQYVTGLSVADPAQARAPRRLKRWLRSVVHAAGRHGINKVVDWIDGSYQQNAEVARIDGSIAFLYGVEPKFAASLDRIWQPALKGSGRGFDLRRESLYCEADG